MKKCSAVGKIPLSMGIDTWGVGFVMPDKSGERIGDAVSYGDNRTEKSIPYVERNCEMIYKSDICIVYYKDSYLPPARKNSRRDLFYYQPKNGTGIAYKYTVQKKRRIINLTKQF